MIFCIFVRDELALLVSKSFVIWIDAINIGNYSSAGSWNSRVVD
jgi:hypothetical protein